MAFVICCVDLTLRMRRRMSMRAGITRFPSLRLARGLGLEHARELLDRALQAVAQLALQVLLLGEVLHEARVPRVQEGVELALETAAVGDADAVEEAARGRVDDRD